MAIEIEIPEGAHTLEVACHLYAEVASRPDPSTHQYVNEPSPGRYTLISSELLTVERMAKLICAVYGDDEDPDKPTCEECKGDQPECPCAPAARNMLRGLGMDGE